MTRRSTRCDRLFNTKTIRSAICDKCFFFKWGKTWMQVVVSLGERGISTKFNSRIFYIYHFWVNWRSRTINHINLWRCLLFLLFLFLYYFVRKQLQYWQNYSVRSVLRRMTEALNGFGLMVSPVIGSSDGSASPGTKLNSNVLARAVTNKKTVLRASGSPK